MCGSKKRLRGETIDCDNFWLQWEYWVNITGIKGNIVRTVSLLPGQAHTSTHIIAGSKLSTSLPPDRYTVTQFSQKQKVSRYSKHLQISISIQYLFYVLVRTHKHTCKHLHLCNLPVCFRIVCKSPPLNGNDLHATDLLSFQMQNQSVKTKFDLAKNFRFAVWENFSATSTDTHAATTTQIGWCKYLFNKGDFSH